METRVNEIAERIFRFSTCIEGVAPGGFTFNQFLVLAEEPLLFHCGMRGLFPLVSEAMKKVMPPSRLRWISFGHVEADESGAMNQWLAAAPNATVVHGRIGCMVSLNDLADRPPRPADDGEVITLGDRRVRVALTPHVPHGWESLTLHEEITGTLLGGDLLTTTGDGAALTEADPLEQVLDAERAFHAWALTPESSAIVRKLAELGPKVIAAMHGSSYAGDGAALLRRLAAGIDDLTDARRTSLVEAAFASRPTPTLAGRPSAPSTQPQPQLR